MRAVSASRKAGRPSSRPDEFPSRATLADPRLGQIAYLHGWWYALTDYLGFVAVRIRLPGDVSGPSPRARAALREIELRADRLARQLDPHLWTYYQGQRAAHEIEGPSVIRSADQAVRGTILREHFRLEAVCAGAYGEAGSVELAIEPRWAPGRWLGAYLEDGQLTEFISNIHAWRTPDAFT